MNEFTWTQNLNPTGSSVLSTIVATLPVITLFFFLAVKRIAAWKAAVAALIVGFIAATVVFQMPVTLALGAIASGGIFGWFRVAWIIIASVFVYEVSVVSGQFEVMRRSIESLSGDRRILALLIPFAFGAVLEGAGGGGAPVAITGAMLVGLGFPPYQAVVVCLVANSAPVAYGGLGGPVRALAAVTGLGEQPFSSMIGRILPFLAMVLPFWLMRILGSTAELVEVWRPVLLASVSFATVQFLWSNFVGAALVDVVAGMIALIALALFLKVAQRSGSSGPSKKHDAKPDIGLLPVLKAWSPFVLLTVCVLAWGAPWVSQRLDLTSWRFPFPGLHLSVVRLPPVVLKPTAEPAIVEFAWITSPGTATFLAGLIAGPLLGLSVAQTLKIFFKTVRKLWQSIVAVLAMLGTGYIIRYCGMDATMGMAMSHTGPLFPFFGTVIGWLGVALSGTDAGSNALFGGLQVITANRLGLSPILMGAANSAGGVMGKMLAAQSLVIGCAATGQQGKEGLVFRSVLGHSLALLAIVGIVVMLYAYVFPSAVPK